MSPLLLKTLLFLLSIYIKRATSAPRSSVETMLESDRIEAMLDDKLVMAGEYEVDFSCPLESLITPKAGPEKQLGNKFLAEHWKKVISNTHVSWLKSGVPLHRENGNQIEYIDARSVRLYQVRKSDEGEYTCLLNTTKAPSGSKRFFEIKQAATFKLRVNEPSHSQIANTIATISHPPADLIVARGSSARFRCSRIVVMSQPSTYWFKCPRCNDKNGTLESFNKAVRLVQTKGLWADLQPFIIEGENGEYLDIHNVTDDDVGPYGCFTENMAGIDIRLGKLDLIDTFLGSTTTDTAPTTTPCATTQSSTDVSFIKPTLLNTTDNLNGGDSTSSTVPYKYISNLTITSVSTVVPSNLTSNHPQQQPEELNPQESRQHQGAPLQSILISICAALVVISSIILILTLCCLNRFIKEKKYGQNNLLVDAPLVGENCQEDKMRSHLPNGGLPDIYNIGKTADGFISGHLHQQNGHLMTQSICSQILDKEKNPSISSNSNSDEASSWGKSMSSHGDHSRAFYSHTSNATDSTVPIYDHPPSTGVAQMWGTLIHDACVINPTYGFLSHDPDATAWNFPRRNLEKLNKIGEGQFGEVWRYIAHQKDGNESYVAVKQLKNRAGLGNRERLELIAEIEIMKLVNDHPNVIKLLNYCGEDYQPILLIMEYAENGKLQTYLRDCRSCRKYGHARETCSSITSKELIKFSYHIAKGMEYVASKGIIHRDLASRNILVSKDKVCKVADFGFARRVSDECAYERTTANPVPVKWMAPEALIENKFTTKSDVFSLGILMWEIVTLGATPYENLTSSEVYKKVCSGGRLERPIHCRDEFYNIMAKCWQHDPSQRPTFKQLACELEQLLLSENDYIELDQYPEHAYYNILNTAEKEIVNVTPGS